MDFIRSFLPHRQPEVKVEPKPLPDAHFKQSFKVEEGQLTIEAQTLDAFYAADFRKGEAQKMLDAVTHTESLKGKDGSKGDFDSRPEHVVLPKEGFEFHSDTGAFKGKADGINVSGDAKQAVARAADQYSIKDATGNWNREEGTFDYQFSVPGSLIGTESPVEKNLITEETFQISSDGRVVLPGAQSLAEAETVAPRREMAQRAEDLIKAAAVWNEHGASLDGKKGVDINPTQGATVAPNLKREEDLGKVLAKETVMSSAHLLYGEDHDEPYPYEQFDLQTGGGQFLVNANTSDPYDRVGASLTGQVDASGANVTFADSQAHTEEQVVWNKEAGTVSYKKFETES